VDQDPTFPSCHLTCFIRTSHSLQYPNHQDITWIPLWHFLSWFVHKTYMVAVVPVIRAILPTLSRNSEVWVHLQIWKVVPISQTSGPPQQVAGQVSPGKGQGTPLPGWNVKSKTSPQIVGIKDPLVPKTDTWERQNLNKAISFDQKGESTYSLQLSGHVRTKWSTLASPYIPGTVVPAPYLGFV
jgi:hypothetical protein